MSARKKARGKRAAKKGAIEVPKPKLEAPLATENGRDAAAPSHDIEADARRLASIPKRLRRQWATHEAGWSDEQYFAVLERVAAIDYERDRAAQDAKAAKNAADEETKAKSNAERAAKKADDDEAEAAKKAADQKAKAEEKAAKDAKKAADQKAKAEEKAAKDAKKAADQKAKAEEKAAKDAKKAADQKAKAEEKAAKDAKKAADQKAKAEEKAAKDAKKAAEATVAHGQTNGAATDIDGDAKPVIRIGVDIQANANEAIRVLAERGDLYQREAYLVHITRVSREEETEASVVVDGVTYRPLIEGTPRIHKLAVATLRENMSTVAQWEKYDGRSKTHKPALPSGPVVSAVHERKQWTGIRRLVAVAEAPFMRPDGAIVQTPGYDPLTGFVYMPSIDFPQVPDRPTQEDAAKALAELRDVFCDFPFVDAAQALVPIAAILTILVRPAITGACPAFTVDATARGSGKTLGTDVIAIVATGRDAARLNFPTRSFRTKNGLEQIPNEEELEKLLGACALSGARLVCFDNIVCEFGGAPLDKALTARDTVQFRILGLSEAPILPWRGIILGCGNNLVPGPDTVRRVLPCRIESETSNPEARTGFKHDRGPVRGAAALIAFVREQRPALVAAALTIARAYVVAGRPSPACVGSFEEWAALVPSSLHFADPSVNVLDARMTDEAEVSDSTAALFAVLSLLPDAEEAHAKRTGGDAQGPLGGVAGRRRGLLAGDLLDTLYPAGKRPDGDVRPTDDRALDPLRDALEEMTSSRKGETPEAKSLGRALKHHLGRVLSCTLANGDQVDRRLVAERDRHTKASRWRVETLSDAR